MPPRASVAGLTVILFAMLLAVPAVAGAAAEVRFVNALAGQPTAAATVDGEPVVPRLEFAVASARVDVAPGRRRVAFDGARATLDFADGERYTVVAVGMRRGRLIALRDGRAESGTSRLRAVHAAAEVGRADVLLDGEPLARDAPLGAASGYRDVEPGGYELAATRPGRGSGAPLVRTDVELVAGTATTALLVGSAGEPLQFVLLEDDAFAPAAAPATGFGGLATVVGGVAPLVRLPLLAARARRSAEPAAAPAPMPPTGALPLRPLLPRRGRAGLATPELESLAGGLRPALPARIQIAAAGVDTVVVPVAARRDAVGVPDPASAGWVESGPRPGERGRAVVVAHRDSPDGPGAFAGVETLAPGARIAVTDQLGRVRRFEVVERRQIAKRAFPADEVYGAARTPMLVLVTCGGAWDGRSYRDNVIVYARAI
jgi:hypothetical protein